jgi:hypothetical protein
MPQRLYKDDEIKLIVLYLLNELDDAYDFQTISEIIVWDGSISYFVFSQCFDELIQSGAIEKISTSDEKDLFAISQIGRISIKEVEDSILGFVKERIMRSATRLLAFKKDGTNICSKIEPKNGGYELSCSIKNKKINLLDINMYFDNKEEAELLQAGFDNQAERVYSSLLALLSGDSKYII